MATLGELLRAVSLDYGILGGAVGVGRDVRRVVVARHAAELSSPIGQGDLIVYRTLDEDGAPTETHDRPLQTLLSSGVSGVVVDGEPSTGVSTSADALNTPLILVRTGLTQAVAETLQQAVSLQNSRLPQLQLTLQRDLLDLARAGATRTMVLERLVEVTGKTGLLQERTALAGEIRQAVRQRLDSAALRAAIDATDGQAQKWIHDTADATVANVLYMEVPSEGQVRLVAPVWIDGWMHAALSLLARPAELTSRDRVALVVAARVIATIGAQTTAELPTGFALPKRQSVAALAIRSPNQSLHTLADAVREQADLRIGELALGDEDVRVWLPYRSADEWNSDVREWHARLSADLGSISVGYTFHRCAKRESVAAAMIHAAEAALISDRLFGPGHLISYADAQLARLMLERADASDLGALYERTIGSLAIEDAKHESGLVRTLEAYCETFATARTAERLGVHRNTVLYRLKRIEAITATDLEDSSTRLMLQLGLLADRLLRKVEVVRNSPPAWSQLAPAP